MGRLLDIIDKHDCYGCEANFELADNRRSDDQIVADVKSLMLELIGPDEIPQTYEVNTDGQIQLRARNVLRRDIRERIAAL